MSVERTSREKDDGLGEESRGESLRVRENIVGMRAHSLGEVDVKLGLSAANLSNGSRAKDLLKLVGDCEGRGSARSRIDDISIDSHGWKRVQTASMRKRFFERARATKALV